MITYLEYKDEKSHKFWQIKVVGESYTVTFGKVGTEGQSRTKSFALAETAKEEAEYQIKSKMKKRVMSSRTKNLSQHHWQRKIDASAGDSIEDQDNAAYYLEHMDEYTYLYAGFIRYDD